MTLARAGRRSGSSPSSVLVEGRRGDRQSGADRLDPVGIAMLFDESHHHLVGGRAPPARESRSLRRLSFARFNSRFSRSGSSSRSRSPVVSPARFPASRSACLTHWCRVCGVQPIFAAHLRRDRRDRRPLPIVVLLGLKHQSDSALADLGRVSSCSCPWLPRLNPGSLGNPGRFSSRIHATCGGCTRAPSPRPLASSPPRGVVPGSCLNSFRRSRVAARGSVSTA